MSREAPDALLAFVLSWLSGEVPTAHVRDGYFSIRRQRFNAGEQYAGPVAEYMSNIDTAMDSFTENPEPGYGQIDEETLRREVLDAVRGLREIGYV